VKEAPFFNEMYTKRVPFMPKVVYESVRVWNSGGTSDRHINVVD